VMVAMMVSPVLFPVCGTVAGAGGPDALSLHPLA